MRQTRHARCRFALLFAATAAFGFETRGFAGLIAGDGKGKPENDCLVELSVAANPLPTGSTITCSDCDGNCDQDQTPDGVCSFQVALCVNQTGCTATELKKAIGKVMGVKGLKTLPAPPSLGASPSCGAFATNFQLKLRGKQKNKP